jgi:hypothetical protein
MQGAVITNDGGGILAKRSRLSCVDREWIVSQHVLLLMLRLSDSPRLCTVYMRTPIWKSC